MARNAARPRVRLPLFGLDTAIRFRSPADRAAFADELTATVARLASRYHDEHAADGRWQRLTNRGPPGAQGRRPARLRGAGARNDVR